MPALTSDAILQVLLARTIGTRETIRVSEVIGSTIPRGVKIYVRADVERRLAAEVERADHTARIGPSAFEAVHLRGLYVRHAADAYLLRRDEYGVLLENAVRFTENYLCRPRWTMRSFLFHDAPTLPASTLLARLEWIPEYAYLPQLLTRVITDRKLNGLSDAACSELIAKIDDAVVREHRPRELARLTAPIFSFYLLSTDPGSSSIPLRPLLLFFEDKGLLGLREHLQGVCHMRNRTGISLGELEELTEDFFGEKPPLPQSEPVPEPEPPHEEELPPAAGPSGGVAPAPPPAVTGPVPAVPEPQPAVSEVTSLLSVSTPSISESTTPLSEPDPVASEPAPPTSEPVPLMLTPAHVVSASTSLVSGPTSLMSESTPAGNEREEAPAGEPEWPTAPSMELQSLITEEQRRRFIHVICDKDEAFYELMIARLDELQTWSEASDYIRELFEINSIDPFHRVAVTFTDIVQRRFPPDGASPL
jgi:hypothetical protein